MAKKRGLSADEKKQKMLEAMLAGKTVYNLKELEKVAKEVALATMIVKDVVQEMLDDDMIIHEKVGTQTLYWIFPSQSYVLKKRKLDSLQTAVGNGKAEKEKLEEEVAKLKAEKPESEKRFELLKQYEELKAKKDELTASLESLKGRDPETIKSMKNDIKVAVDGANRWTDNIWSVKSYMTKKYGMDSKQADQALEITDDFDNIELPDIVRNA